MAPPKATPTGSFTVAPGLGEAAASIGLYGNRVEEFIRRMAEDSAPYQHAAGNRRYYAYVLDVKDGVVVGIGRLDKEDVPMARVEFAPGKALPAKAQVTREIVQQAIAKHFPGSKR